MVSTTKVRSKPKTKVNNDKVKKIRKSKNGKRHDKIAVIAVLEKTPKNEPWKIKAEKLRAESNLLGKSYVMPSTSITGKIVSTSLNAIQKLSEQYKKGNKLFEDESAIFLEIHCIKIQSTKGNITCVLPHSTVSSTGHVCLITPDIKKGRKSDHEPTIDLWEEKLRKAGVTEVKTVLPMRQLRVEYDQFELKRRLLTQHDFIMVDTRVLNHVSHLLGKTFFKKHNMLIPVRVKEGDRLKDSIDHGLRTAMLRVSLGETSTILVGHTGMPQKKIKENILSVVEQLKKRYPGGESNIRSIFVKLPLSVSVPLYVTLRSANSVFPPKMVAKRPKHFSIIEDELSTIPGSKVSVAPDGTVHLKRDANMEDSDLEVDMVQDEAEDDNDKEEAEQSD